MAQASPLELRFPVGGLNRRLAFQQQAPYTTVDALNVRPRETMKGRERGGSRPGLGKAFITQLGSGNPIRMLNGVTVVAIDPYQSLEDNFKGTTMGDAWTAASWLAGGLPAIFPGDYADVVYGSSPVGAIRSAVTFDTTQPYLVETYLTPYSGAHHGTYSIFLKMNDTTPVVTTDGVLIELTVTGATGVYSGSAKVYAGGVLQNTYTLTGGTTGDARPGWFTCLWTPSTSNLKVYWLGTLILNQNTAGLGGSAGNRFGFGMNAAVSGGICLVDTFRLRYKTNVKAQIRTRYLVASSNGLLYRDDSLGAFTQISSNLTLASDRFILSAEYGQKLYIADWSDLKANGNDGTVTSGVLDAPSYSDWTTIGIDQYSYMCEIYDASDTTKEGTYPIGSIHATNGLTLTGLSGTFTCSYRIYRGPKIYDPVAGTITLWTAAAAKGAVPIGCKLITRYRSRLVLAGDLNAPNAWYATRVDDPTDLDYAAVATDGSRAIAAGSTEAGTVGQPILALITHSDDYLIFGCESSLWLMRGDAAAGGRIDNLSHNVGCVGAGAWCEGPKGETILMARDGLYAVAGGPGGPEVVKLSGEVLPREMQDLDPEQYTVLLKYEPRDCGIHIWLTPTLSKSQYHFFFDWQTKTFWPVGAPSTMEPTSIAMHHATSSEDSGVMMGCRDGYVRKFHKDNERDDGTAFSSYVWIGPIKLGGSGYFDGLIAELQGITGEGGGDVAWALHVGGTPEAAFNSTAFLTGTWTTAGRNYKDRPRARGCAGYLKISNGETGRQWAFEYAMMVVQRAGVQRVA